MELHQSKYTGEEMDALFDKANYKIGTYNGNGNASQFINLGFTPSAVLVAPKHGLAEKYGGLALKDHIVNIGTSGTNYLIEIVENGFNVFYNSSASTYTNASDAGVNPFRYIAFR